MITFMNGDMFAVPADIRVNTVNCNGVMGAGVALAFRQRYPMMYKDYQRACKAGEIRPGRLHDWKSLEGDWIINFPTKRDWRESSRYEDIEAGLDALHNYLKPLGKVSVALPALGCGHGGLDWSRVSTMIEKKLSDVAAHIKVFEPLDSKRAGNQAMSEATDDEIKSAYALGYKREVDQEGHAYYSKGIIELSGQKWIALVPSRQPSERELSALQAVAAALQQEKRNVCVSIIHSSQSSEEIARIFSSFGVQVTIIFPFGVLTRKTLSKVVADNGHSLISILSWAPPNQKWSRVLFAQAMNSLRSYASALLLSDPEPEWLLKRISAWHGIPIGYLRYQELSEDVRNRFSSVGAQPLGRRSDSGQPNLKPLLGSTNDEGSADAPPGGPLFAEQGIAQRSDPVVVDVSNLSEEDWNRIVAAIKLAQPKHIQLTIEANDASAHSELASLFDRILGDRIRR